MILKIVAKVRDAFSFTVINKDWEELISDDGYVPDFMPGNHYGDYVILDIDVETGKVLNWQPSNVTEGIYKILEEGDWALYNYTFTHT